MEQFLGKRCFEELRDGKKGSPSDEPGSGISERAHSTLHGTTAQKLGKIPLVDGSVKETKILEEFQQSPQRSENDEAKTFQDKEPSCRDSMSRCDVSRADEYLISETNHEYSSTVELNAVGCAQKLPQHQVDDDSAEFEDLGDIFPNLKGRSKKFDNMLKLILFPASGISLEDVLNMTQAIYLRFKTPKATRMAFLELIKLLAGPEFKNLHISDYYVSLYNKPAQDYRTYTFSVRSAIVPFPTLS
ncbi:hypothetical protein QAD02_012954 [Eretmocerus hayati]|uniref:Uncharacterized protein n=1 Tax=Eretmocerus hayati TaxID=131215 RepID=A0ACC2P1C4_9HYME|nr:hypothetical protein QAD02_012954 [Eretmocerus hayati]